MTTLQTKHYDTLKYRNNYPPCASYEVRQLITGLAVFLVNMTVRQILTWLSSQHEFQYAQTQSVLVGERHNLLCTSYSQVVTVFIGDKLGRKTLLVLGTVKFTNFKLILFMIFKDNIS